MRGLALLPVLLTSCVSAIAPTAESEPSECLVDGRPLSSFQPLLPCHSEMTTNLAHGVRLYVASRFEEAAATLESELAGDELPRSSEAWQQARYFLARSYAHLGREAEARELHLATATTPGDPYAWSAAGHLCGEGRPTLLGVEARDPHECDDTAEPVVGVAVPNFAAVQRAFLGAWSSMAACGAGRSGFGSLEILFEPGGTVADARLVATGWYDDSDGAYGTPTEACMLEVAGTMTVPPFTSSQYSVILTFGLE